MSNRFLSDVLSSQREDDISHSAPRNHLMTMMCKFQSVYFLTWGQEAKFEETRAYQVTTKRWYSEGREGN